MVSTWGQQITINRCQRVDCEAWTYRIKEPTSSLLLVETENRAKILQPTPLSGSGQRAMSSHRNKWLYKMPNTTRQKMYFATILDLEHQGTPLTTQWVAHFWKQTFRVVSSLWKPWSWHRPWTHFFNVIFLMGLKQMHLKCFNFNIYFHDQHG